MNNFSDKLRNELVSRIGECKFNIPNLLEKPLKMGCKEVNNLECQNDLIKQFYSIVIDIARNGLENGEETLCNLLFSESPAGMSVDYHKRLPLCCWEAPLIYRTDQSVSGKIYEIQAPGSGWGDIALFAKIYNDAGYELPQWVLNFAQRYEKCFASELLSESPKIFYMIDAASVPQSARYLMSITKGNRYWGYDSDLKMHDMDYVVSHSVISLVTSNYFKEYLKSAEKGKCKFVISPNLIFDEKVIYLLPFYRRTRDKFNDEIRSVFPFTTLIENDGFFDENDEFVTLKDFCKRKPSCRKFFLKYGGPDTNRNWGSRSVYRLSGNDCEKLLEMASNLTKKGEVWLIQKDESNVDTESAASDILSLINDGNHVKLSAYYGKDMLLGIKVMARKHFKVHGQKDTFVGLGV